MVPISWSDPSTHVYAVGEIVSASTMNTFIKDNLIDLDRRTTTTGATVLTDQSTATTSYTDLATTGPAVTVTIGTTGLAQVALFANMYNANALNSNFMSWAVSGATTVNPSDDFAIEQTSSDANASIQVGAAFQNSSLTAGSNTFTSKYHAASGTAHFTRRRISVTPLGS